MLKNMCVLLENLKFWLIKTVVRGTLDAFATVFKYDSVNVKCRDCMKDKIHFIPLLHQHYAPKYFVN